MLMPHMKDDIEHLQQAASDEYNGQENGVVYMYMYTERFQPALWKETEERTPGQNARRDEQKLSRA